MSDDVTGRDLIRRALKNLGARANIAGTAQDLHIPAAVLDAFTYHGGSLPPDKLKLLALRIFEGHAEYDGERDLLRKANRAEATTLSAPGYPPPVSGKPLPVFPRDWTPFPAAGTESKKPRPGWAE